MTKVFKSSELLKKLARINFKKHSFIIEWRTFILISIILKISAMTFSVFAGYYYFNQLFISILNSAFLSSVFGVIVLLIVEILTAISLSKFFKFALRLEMKSAMPILFLSIFFFSISFVSSTNGLALRQSQKIDNTEIITAQYNDKILNVNLLYDDKKALVKERINTIKANPQGWTKGKRTILLSYQLKRIDDYYNDLQKSEKNRKQELNGLKSKNQNDLQLNSKYMNLESEKYYKIVSVLMLMIFLINGLLMFFYSKIFNENEAELATVEVIKTFSTDINNKAVNLIENQIQDTFNMYFSAIQNNFDTLQEDKNINKSIGFNTNNVTTNKVDTTKGKTENRTCLHCSKEFIYRTWNQKFCCDNCRITHWENKTNRKVIKGKKK